MGHIRLGRLPKTRRWREVVDLVVSRPDDVPAVASAVVIAAEDRLRQLAADHSVAHCFWLLTRITWASRSTRFVKDVSELGIDVRSDTSALAFISLVADRAREQLSQYPESGPFSDLAALALRRALSETVGQQGPSLFGSSVDDLRLAFQAHSTQLRFGGLARRYFADFFARTLRYFVDRELPNAVGQSSELTTLDDGLEFDAALDLYARQSALIVEAFAGAWYGKHNWQSKGEISLEEARGFTAAAMRKLRMELKLGGG